MQYHEIMEMVKEVAGLGASSFKYSEGDIHVSINFSENIQGNAQLPGTPAKNSPQTTESDAYVSSEEAVQGSMVNSPLVGTFYAAPSEDSDPYVRVGDHVRKGQTLAIVEAMKLMNEIESEYDGTVEQILVENNTPVEYGQPLFRIQEDR